MKPESEETKQVINLLKQGPLLIRKATDGVQTKQLHVKTDEEPWSINDILIQLRACSDVWGGTIMKMLTEDNPTRRYKSPRSFMKKPKYQDPEFADGLESYVQERKKLMKVLISHNGISWSRPGTYTGTPPHHRNQTVLSLAQHMVNHEQPHLDQIETLLK